ncbi:MAG TPA: hypothetical protein VFN61_17060 [Acidimicrobiales bacterium]|nr:hypothetical protein [Acidimicrobiales bacterium]
MPSAATSTQRGPQAEQTAVAVASPGWSAQSAVVAPFAPRRSVADRLARRLLVIREPEPGTEQVYNVFSSSILLSATRCLLTYIIFPALGLVPGLFGHSFAHTVTASAIGLPIGLAALVSDVMAIRRFFRADHRWRWVAAALYLTIMGMVGYLVAQDIIRLS